MSVRYVSETNDIIDPNKVEIPSLVIAGQSVTATVTKSTSFSGYGTITYIYEYTVDGSAWKQFASTTATSASFTVPDGAVTIKVRVKAKDDIGFTSADYVMSNEAVVSDPKVITISRESGNIGTITGDIDFHVSSDVVDTATVSVQVGEFIQTFEATIGTTYWINVLDFLVGEGTVTITATAEVGETMFKEVSNLVYTKAAQEFPSDNVNVGVLKVGGKKSYPLSLAENVRVPGGTTLDVVLSDVLNRIAELEATPPGPDIRDRTLIQDLADSAGTNTFNQTTGFTPSQSAVINMLIDYDFQGPDMANLFCIGHNPSEWNTDALRFYIRNGDTVGFVCHFFQQRQSTISVTGVATGHHKLVFKLVCSSPYTVTAWLDGVKIFSNNCGSSYAGEWYMSNAEGITRFKGTYNEISILRSVLTDEELLNASKLNE